MLYYDLADNGYITGFTQLDWVADIKGYKYTTEENIVMQKDGSGFVLESKYDDTLPPPANNGFVSVNDMVHESTADLQRAVESINDALIEVMFAGEETEAEEDG